MKIKSTRLFMALLFVSNPADAQMFEGSSRWDDDDESTLIVGKWSQLFYEVNVGWNVSDFEHYAEFPLFWNRSRLSCEYKRMLGESFSPSNKYPQMKKRLNCLAL